MFGIPFHEVDLGRPRPGNFLLRGAVGLYASASRPPDIRELGGGTNPEPADLGKSIFPS